MRLGRFDDAKREYVIETPKTPVRWINYIGTRSFGGFVDQVGGGVICKNDPGLNRIVKYLPQRPQSDFNGETAYLRERIKTESGSDEARWRLSSPYFVPILRKAEAWECRVGLGYNIYDCLDDGIRIRVTIFVPPGEDRVIRRYEVRNESKRPRTLDLIPVVEFSHFDALKQFTNADWVPQTMQASALRNSAGKTVGVKQAAFMMNGEGENWFAAAGGELSSYETDRERFLGAYGFNGWASPASLDVEELSGEDSLRGNNIAALMLHLGSLEPGDTRIVVTMLGQAADAAAVADSVSLWGTDEAVEGALKQLAGAWNDSLDRFQVETPAPEMDSLINIHNARQCRITANWSRYLSLYQLGLGARGMGFRDTSQDVMGILHAAPEEGKALLRMLLSVQKRNGSALHQFFPLTMEANEGDSREEPDRPDFYGDDHLWVVMAVGSYIRETGDYNFLSEEIAFYEKDSTGEVIEKAPVGEHMRRALAFTREHTGTHGLPLLGFADWNDTINLPTGAESMMIANLYGTALSEMASLLEYVSGIGTSDSASLVGVTDPAGWLAWIRDARTEMQNVFRLNAWDGKWWRRYFDEMGNPIGSDQNGAGKIWLNAQSWAIISGFADEERGRIAMDSAYDKMNTEHGIKLSWPGYNGYDEHIGGASTYPPGAKENGGIFLHSNPWAMIAETKLGRGDRAWQYYRQINPAARNERIEEFEVEPYCYPQNILGDEHPQHGLGRNSWLSGTASWCWQASTQYILGIRPDHQGLKVDPCIPADWPEFSVNRRFRGTKYHITVRNPDRVGRGVRTMSVDGIGISGNIVPLKNSSNTQVVVEVVLG